MQRNFYNSIVTRCTNPKELRFKEVIAILELKPKLTASMNVKNFLDWLSDCLWIRDVQPLTAWNIKLTFRAQPSTMVHYTSSTWDDITWDNIDGANTRSLFVT